LTVSYNIRANLDPLGEALQKLKADAHKEGRTLAKVESNVFLRIMKRFSWESAPTRETIKSVYERLGWRMRRRRGTKTPEAERDRRLRARGTFARAWFVVSVTEVGSRIRILLKDKADYSSQIAERDGTIEKAQQRTLRGWGDKLNRVARRLAGNF
jgi:hypothetical protein